jgi:predicted Zn-dependent protease
LKGTASGYLAHLAWTEAVYGGARAVAERVKQIITLMDPDSGDTATLPRFRAAAALGLVGFPAEAEALVDHAEQRYPEATFVKTVLAPSTHAAVALNQGRPDAAIDALRAAVPTELGTVAGLLPGYLRGEALFQKGRLIEAAREYESILQHRGVDPFAPVIPMAHLGLARARARAGDAAGSRRAYEDLLTIWSAADAGFAPLAAARAEYTRLTTPNHPGTSQH